MSTLSRRAIFLDKDGTLIEDVPYNVDPELIRLAPGAVSALPRLRDAGFRFFVVSNQSGVARGLFEEASLKDVHGRLAALVGDLGVSLDGFYYCPHHPAGTVARYVRECDCRKPKPGLILAAAREHAVDLGASWFVGDILDDVEAGRRAGCQTILINNGNETEWEWTPLRRPDYIAADLDEAARYILAGAAGDTETVLPSPEPPGPGEPL